MSALSAPSTKSSPILISEHSVHILRTEAEVPDCLNSRLGAPTVAHVRYTTFLFRYSYTGVLQSRLGRQAGDCSAGEANATSHILPSQALPLKGTCSLL
jgi:hypothetical protein